MADDGDEKPNFSRAPPVRVQQDPSTSKAVHQGFHNDTAETISPLLLGKSKECDEFALDGNRRSSGSIKHHKHRPRWLTHHKISESPRTSPALDSSISTSSSVFPQSTPTEDVHQTRAVVAQAWEWLNAEKQKRRLRKHKPKKSRDGLDVIKEDAKANDLAVDRTRRDSSGSDTSTALDELEDILRKDSTLQGPVRRQSAKSGRKKSHLLRRSVSSLRPRRHSTAGVSSDTDGHDKEISVPTCETWLDNSKTLSRTTGLASLDETGEPYTKTMTEMEREAWASFQREILTIAHTLQLKRWRRVPLERSDNIVVEKLSGALTNAVYTVSPPRDLSSHDDIMNGDGSQVSKPRSRVSPGKLLLRIYGPQVEHLIDRDAELQILRRLGRQNIGPRLLGTFNNGRFEEYIHAKALTPFELRQPDISRQIAKRMRELHDGIELTHEERKNGPFVWHNWNKWLTRCERIVTYIDGQVTTDGVTTPAISRLRNRGFVCGTPWEAFKKTVDKFRLELTTLYGGIEHLKRELVFAHNDTQYGNILRREPPGESPLLLPANIHKQLVVIDFEYSNANTRGLEFANHFTEWCYNYHHPELSFDCQTTYYPTPEEQVRFIRAYLEHQPKFAPAAATPRLGPTRGSVSSLASVTPSSRNAYFSPVDAQHDTSSAKSSSYDSVTPTPLNESLSSLNLARVDTGQSERAEWQQAELEARVAELMHETRLWRIANSAQWVAWAIVQARVPGLNSQPHDQIVKDTATDWTERQKQVADSNAQNNATTEEEDVEFDYLSYARSRAMFFWGDCVQHGLIRKEDLPKDVQEGLKVVNY